MRATFERLSKIETENEQKSRRYYNQEVQNYVQCLNLVDEVLGEIASELRKGNIEKREFAVLCICHRIVGTSKVFHDLVIKGYHYDAFILLRSLLENLTLLIWFMDDKDNVEKWWLKKGQKLNFEIRKELGMDDISNSLKFFNNYVHSNYQAFRTLVEPIKREKGAQTFGIFTEPRFREKDVKTLLYPIVGKITLNIFLKNYEKCLKAETKLRILSIVRNSEKEIAELFKT